MRNFVKLFGIFALFVIIGVTFSSCPEPSNPSTPETPPTQPTAPSHICNPWNAADCTNAEICTDCGKVITAALGHSPGLAATCITAQNCTDCDEILQDILEHDWEYAQNAIPPTCTTEGFGHRYCLDCDANEVGGTYQAIGHTPSDLEVIFQAGCETEGMKKAKCVVCEEVVQTQTIQPNNHTWGAWAEIQAADFRIEGQKKRACVTPNCNATHTEQTAALTLQQAAQKHADKCLAECAPIHAAEAEELVDQSYSMGGGMNLPAFNINNWPYAAVVAAKHEGTHADLYTILRTAYHTICLNRFIDDKYNTRHNTEIALNTDPTNGNAVSSFTVTKSTVHDGIPSAPNTTTKTFLPSWPTLGRHISTGEVERN